MGGGKNKKTRKKKRNRKKKKKKKKKKSWVKEEIEFGQAMGNAATTKKGDPTENGKKHKWFSAL